MEVQRGGGRPDSVSRAGEWKLVWKPALAKPAPLRRSSSLRNGELPKTSGVRRNWGPGSRPLSTSGLKAHTPLPVASPMHNGPSFHSGIAFDHINSHVGRNPASDRLASRPQGTGLSRTAPVSRPASVQGASSGRAEIESITTPRSVRLGLIKKLRLPSRGSDVSSSARSGLSTMSQMTVPSSAMRLGTGKAMDSQRSHSSMASSTYSAYSDLTSASQQDEILKRIKGLEDALNAERALRLQMQTLIQTKVPSTILES